MGYKAVALNTGLIKVREIQSYNKNEYVNINSNLSVSGNLNVFGNTIIQSKLTSTNFDNGALQVKGGVSMKGNMNLQGNLNIGGIYNSITKQTEESMLVVKHPYIVPSGTDSGSKYDVRVGINTTQPLCVLDINSTDAVKIPIGTRNERPVNPKTGMIRYNTELSLFEGYGEAWGSLGGSSDIDADTDINVDTYYEDTPSGDNDDDIIRFTNRGIQNMIIDHTGKVGLGNVYHENIREQEIMDGYIQHTFSSTFANSKRPTTAEYDLALTNATTGYYNVGSVVRRNGWAQADLTDFLVLAATYSNNFIISNDIHYHEKTGDNGSHKNYGNFDNYLKKLPQSTLEVHGNVAISSNLNVGGYIMMPINKHIYLSEDKNDYIISKDDNVGNNHLEIKCTEGDINLTAGSNIVIPSNVKLLFGNKDQSIRENGNNNLIINTSGNFTKTIGNNYIVNSSGDNSIVSTSNNIELTSTNSDSESSLKLLSNIGGINLQANNTKDINITSGQVLVETQHNISDAIKLQTNSGNAETINIINVEGENNPGIRLLSLKGGMEIIANKSTSITGSNILLESKINQEKAILIQTNNETVGTTDETILIENQKGNSLNAIQIQSSLGGINLNSKKDIYLNSEEKIQFNSNNSGFQFIGTSSNNITFEITVTSGTFLIGDIIEGATSKATVIVTNATNQNSLIVENLLGTFVSSGENITASPSGATGTFTNINYSNNQNLIDITNQGKTTFKNITDSSRTDNELNTYIGTGGWSLRNDIDFISYITGYSSSDNYVPTAQTGTTPLTEGTHEVSVSGGNNNAKFTVTVDSSGNLTNMVIKNNAGVYESGANFKIKDTITFTLNNWDNNTTLILQRIHVNILAEEKLKPDPSVKIAGGALVSKDLWVEQNVNVLQNLNVFGNNIQIQAEQLVIDDPLIIIGLNQNTTLTSDDSYAGIMNRYKFNNSFKYDGLVRTPITLSNDSDYSEWNEQIDGTNWGGEWHLLKNIANNNDNQSPNIVSNNLDSETEHSDLHISNLKLLGTNESNAFNRGTLVLTQGGIGVNKQVNIGGDARADWTGSAGTANNAALVVKGGISLAKNIFMNKQTGTADDDTRKIQWSDTQYINVFTDNGIDTMNINADSGKVSLIASTGGDSTSLGSIQFRHNNNDSFSFDDSGRIKVDGNLVLDVNGDIIFDVPSSSKHFSYRVNEHKFFSIYDDGSYNAVLKNTYATHNKHTIIKSSKDVELIRFTDTLVKLDNNINFQIGSDTYSYIKSTSNNLLFNVNNDLVFNVRVGNVDTEIVRLNKTDSSLQIVDNKKLTFSDANQYILGTSNSLTLEAGTGNIIHKINDIEYFKTNKSTGNIIINSDKKLCFDTSDNFIYAKNSELYLQSSTINFDSHIRIPSQSKLYIGSDNQYITNDGSNVNFEFKKTNVLIKAGDDTTTKQLKLESDGDLTLTGGQSSNGIVKVLNNTAADLTSGALRVDGGITIAENVVSTGFKTYGPLELRNKIYYVPEILYYKPGTDQALKDISGNTVLSIISVEQEMTDHYYVQLLDGVYNGQIKKIVLHPRYEANRSVNGNHINIDIDHFCDPDGGAQTNATLILNRGGQTLNLIWIGLDAYTTSGNTAAPTENPHTGYSGNLLTDNEIKNNVTSYWMLLDNNFDYL
jgi:hypothetical protein